MTLAMGSIHISKYGRRLNSDINQDNGGTPTSHIIETLSRDNLDGHFKRVFPRVVYLVTH